MGRLAGFRYKQIIKKLKKDGFYFDRHAAGSHEIWYNPKSNRYKIAKLRKNEVMNNGTF